ncbi:MAG: hypothetical protein LBP51_07865, partial [Deferribacteraceae bacterium]|nr:hypothetical protein [Deferribacteraceae bacterium]
ERDINLIDFKTSSASNARQVEYAKQMELYKKALYAYYNIPVNAYLFYVHDGAATVESFNL